LKKVISDAGFTYTSNQSILCYNIPKELFEDVKLSHYERALDFYKPWDVDLRPSLPMLNDNLVEIPVSLPDDEILIERLDGDEILIESVWKHILYQSYQRGELFTLQLHPERIWICQNALSTIIREARLLFPTVWCARMDEVAAWWKARHYDYVTETGD
jgi:hypothetical protein